MKTMGKFLSGFLLLLIALFLTGNSSKAAGNEETVDVVIPTELSIVFEENGANGVGEFCVKNQSLVPIVIDSVYVTECNGWKLVPGTNAISVDEKKLAFELEDCYLQAGENAVNISVLQNTERKLGIAVKRGAWTISESIQSAFRMEFEYTIGQNTFQLYFNENGGAQKISTRSICNGQAVILPVVTRNGYDFLGWEDKDGKLYTDSYVMPIGDVTLTAKWAMKVAYAVYSADDNSLSFYNTSKTVSVGGKYNGKTVTAVYTGFLNQGYTSRIKPPWSADYELDIKKIIVEDVISPTTTQGWFLYTRNCTYVDVTKLDMSNVTTTQMMFSLTGNNATTFRIVGMKNWNMSKVTNIDSMFSGTGQMATTFYIEDISGWDVSNVTSMKTVFSATGQTCSNWSLDLRKWNVKKVTNHNRFAGNGTTKITEPLWVN